MRRKVLVTLGKSPDWWRVTRESAYRELGTSILLIVFSSEHGLQKDFEAFEHVRDGAKNVDAEKNGCIWPIFNPKKYAQLGHNWEGQEILKFLIVGIDLFRSEGFF